MRASTQKDIGSSEYFGVNSLATDAELAEMLWTVSPRPIEGEYERGDSTLSI